MGSVISQSLNIKTKIVCDLSASGEQDSVSSASVSPLWPEVTNYSVISHLSCLSFLNRMSIYTQWLSVPPSLSRSCWRGSSWRTVWADTPVWGRAWRRPRPWGTAAPPAGWSPAYREDYPDCWGQLIRTHFLRQWVKLRWRGLLQPRLMIPGDLITIVPSRFCSLLSLHLLAGQWGGALGREK